MKHPSVTDQVAGIMASVEGVAVGCRGVLGHHTCKDLAHAARLIDALAAEVEAWRNAELDDCGAGVEADAGYCILAASQLATDALLAEVKRG